MKIFKYIFVNLLLTLFLYSLACLPFFFLIDDKVTSIQGKVKFNANTIRSTYPNYADLSPEVALKIFTGYAAPKSSYKPFTAYRRNEYASEYVNIDSDGIRASYGHAKDAEFVFLGGSTMWGTGATDNDTIPSLFFKLSGNSVINLGESGYNSVQELNQLIKYIHGTKTPPVYVIFYDGVNDGYRYCMEGNIPTHSYVSRYTKYIEEYPKLKALKTQKTKKLIEDLPLLTYIAEKYSLHEAVQYLKAPLTFFKSMYKSDAKPYSDAKLSTETPFSEISPANKILNCDDNENATKAAKITVMSWLMAYSYLEKLSIKPVFILQPTSQIYSHQQVMLDYLIDTEKQLIADTKSSYINFYNHVKDEWRKNCTRFGACDKLLDLSLSLKGMGTEVFIDHCHLSANGNLVVAQHIYAYVKQQQ